MTSGHRPTMKQPALTPRPPAPPTAFADVQGKCPACGKTGLFLGAGGYITCPRIECPEPDAASTLLEGQPEPAPAEAQTDGGGVGPTPAGTVDNPDGLRDQIAAAISAKVDGTEGCANPHRLADAVLAVPAIQQLQAEIGRLEIANRALNQAALEAIERAEQAEAALERVRAIPRLPHSSQQTGELGRAYTRGWESVINAIDTAVGRPQEQRTCRRCGCPASAPDCTHCNCCDVPDKPARDR